MIYIDQSNNNSTCSNACHFSLQEAGGPTKTSKNYKGVHFGKLTSKRTDFVGKAGPGPGEYEPYIEMQMRPENINALKEEPPRETNIPRYHEAISKEVEKKVCFIVRENLKNL